MQQLVVTGATPGAAAVLSVGGTTFEANAGVASVATQSPLGPHSRFQLGCITKLLTSLVALEFADAGHLDLDAPIGPHLPELSGLAVAEEITPRHLLSHTSGYRGTNISDVGVRFYYDWNKFARLLLSGSRRFAPGKVFDYEHTECVLLGKIMENLSSERIHDLHQRLVLEPLGIQCGHLREDATTPGLYVADHSFDAASRRYVPLRSVPHCAFWDASLSDLTISLPDLVRIGQAVAGLTTPALFSSHTLRDLRETQVVLPPSVGGPLHEQVPIAFGLGLSQYGETVFGHNGSARGQTCALRFDASCGAVLAVGLSTWRPHVRDLICARVLGAIAGRTAQTHEHTRAPTWDFPALAGRYLGAHGIHVDVSATATQLTLDVCNSAASAATRIAATRNAEGTIEVHSAAPHLTVSFFGEPDTQRGALMIGLNAYCKESPA